MKTYIMTDAIALPIVPFRQEGENAQLVYKDNFCIVINPSKILFPDGLVRDVPDECYLYREANKELNCNGIDSEVALGIKESSYIALYAVATDDKRGIVIGSFATPMSFNYKLLNEKFGLWKYLGMVFLKLPTERELNHSCEKCLGKTFSRKGSRIQVYSCGYWIVLNNLEYLEWLA